MSRTPFRSVTGALAAVALVGAGAALVATSSPAGAAPGNTATFSSPGAATWVVPPGVMSVEIDVRGAQGGAGGGLADPDGIGGKGGRLLGRFDVTPGETLHVHVGGVGTNGDDGAYGGTNGGGQGGVGCINIAYGGGGGGASDVRQGGDALTNRIVVAGGGRGGGTGDYTVGASGGVGGGNVPTDGGDGDYYGMWTVGGGDAPVGAHGGVRGTGGSDPQEIAGSDGALGVGGAGADSPICGGGSGGGGGYYGGGGGAAGGQANAGGAGGGGSSYWLQAGNNSLDASANGLRLGDGVVTISWTTPTPTTTAPPTSTTTVPTPAPAPKVVCPTSIPPLRVFTNVFSLNVARYLIDHCGVTGRETAVGGQSFWVLDPPATSACPTWRAVRVVRSRNSLLIAEHLIKSCQFSVRVQMEGKAGAVYVVPDGYPVGARVIAG